MTIEQVIFTPQSDVPASQEHPHTYAIMVNDEMYHRYRDGDRSIPLVDVVDTFDVLKYENPGTNGRLVRPSNRELSDAFGTTNDMDCVEFMLENGELRRLK